MAEKLGSGTHAVDAWTARSLYIWTESMRGRRLNSATGFIVERAGHHFLLTAGHVLSGVDPETGTKLTAATPTTLGIYHHSALMRGGIGGWTASEERLFNDQGEPRWFTHPRRPIKHPDDLLDEVFERKIDVAVLPLQDLDDHYVTYAVEVGHVTPDVPPSVPVSVVGFPFGVGADAMFPIWKTGHVASDLSAHHNQRYLLLDITTREGMSGSPVYVRDRRKENGAWEIETTFLGLYSGRIRADSEVGVVWRTEIVNATIEAALAALAT